MIATSDALMPNGTIQKRLMNTPHHRLPAGPP
jgi:hypothetical protein